MAEALAEAVSRDDHEAGRNQAHQHHPERGLLHDEQVHAHGQRAEVEQAQDPDQRSGRGLTQERRTGPKAPARRDGHHGVQAV